MPFGNFQWLGLEPHTAARLNHLSKRTAATFRMRGIMVVDLTPFMEELMGLADQNTGSPWNLMMTAELAQKMAGVVSVGEGIADELLFAARVREPA